jgi:hypothetical protein
VKLDSAAPPEIAEAMWNISTRWPSTRNLVIEVNLGDSVGRSWLPFDLASPVHFIAQRKETHRFLSIGSCRTSIKYNTARPRGTKQHSIYTSW